jgi:hypothetical protein
MQGEGVEHVVIGAAALNAHDILRATEEVDMMARQTEANVARLRRALRSVWDDAAIDEITAADLAGDYPVVRCGPPEGSLYIDIVARVGEAFPFDAIECELIDSARFVDEHPRQELVTQRCGVVDLRAVHG